WSWKPYESSHRPSPLPPNRHETTSGLGKNLMWRGFQTAHDKVDAFRDGRNRQSDDEFLAECHLTGDPEARRIGLAVRRAVAGVGLIDPLFIRASDRFPEDLGVLPLWDSMDWMSLILELERELETPPPSTIEEWGPQGRFSVQQLAQAVYEQLTIR
ncbi:MAG TPA: hypothetical protein VFT74_12755, partial [Isosphaeraceae bacterium]|nr:hypothetical protein [Isosphaeraceae bacterium]